MHSCLYLGRVRHVRREPVAHRFAYRLAMAYLDLDEAANLLRQSWLASAARFAPLAFRAEDHRLGECTARSPSELAEAVRDEVRRVSGIAAMGPVRLLTQLRHFGFYFSPLNLFFCFDESGQRLAAVVAEVSNTPWNERRLYVLHPGNETSAGSDRRYRHVKDFHVSPFMGMNARYDWRLNVPDNELRIRLASSSGAGPPFVASLALVRRPWNDRHLASYLGRFPVASWQLLAAIYWQAARLWWKQCPYYPHPGAVRRLAPIPTSEATSRRASPQAAAGR